MLSRVINPEGAGKERTQLTRAVVLAIRELIRQTEPGPLAQDLAAFIALALKGIFETIDISVAAWEKRGYWVKADRFRMDWAWSDQLGSSMEKAVISDDWATVARLSVQIADKLKSVKVPLRNRLGEPWVGAFDLLKSRSHLVDHPK
jgi:hypothetical protein